MLIILVYKLGLKMFFLRMPKKGRRLVEPNLDVNELRIRLKAQEVWKRPRWRRCLQYSNETVVDYVMLRVKRAFSENIRSAES